MVGGQVGSGVGRARALFWMPVWLPMWVLMADWYLGRREMECSVVRAFGLPERSMRSADVPKAAVAGRFSMKAMMTS